MFWTKCKLCFDRAIASNGLRQWAIPFLSFCVSLVIFSLILLIVNKGWCVVGNVSYDATDSFEPQNILDAAFYHMYTNGGQNLFYSHFWGAIITLVGIIVIAILTSSITNFFEQRAKQYLSGETSYYFKNHIVVLGASDMLYSIIEQLNGIDYTYLIIQTGRNVESTRREVFSFLKDSDDTNRIVFFYGDRTSPKDLRRLYLNKAKEVYIIGDATENENGESYRDAYNIDSLTTIKEVIKNESVEAALTRRKSVMAQMKSESNPEREKQLKDEKELIEKGINKLNRLRCNVMFEYQTTFSSFQDSDIDYDTKAYIDFEPFSFHEIWARKVLVYGDKTYDYKPLDQISTDSYINKSSEKSVHLIIVGMSKMGIAMALEAAQVCHYPNYVTMGKKTRITFIDPDADVEQSFFAGRFSHLKNLSIWECVDASSPSFRYKNYLSSKTQSRQDWLDVEWEFVKGRVEQESVRSFLSDAVSDNSHIVSLAICLPKSHQAVAAAIYLPKVVHKKCLQILVYQRISASLITQISSNPDGDLASLRPFGMVDKAFTASSHDDTRAMKVAYAYDMLYDEFSNLKEKNPCSTVDLRKQDDYGIEWEKVDYKLLGFDPVSYHKKDTWRLKVVNRWSSRANANSISVKLRSVNAHLIKDRTKMEDVLKENLHLLMQMEHNRWNIEKLIAGYRPYSTDELNKIPEYKTPNWEKYVDALKRDKAHIDLCCCSELEERDFNNVSFDEVLIRTIPYIMFPVKTTENA